MKKHQTNHHIRSTILRPVNKNTNTLTFRQLVKFRNQLHGTAAMQPQNTSQTYVKSVRQSRYSSAEPVERVSQDQSPIKQFVKQHLVKQPIAQNKCSLTLRASTSNDNCNLSMATCSRLEETLIQDSDCKSTYSLQELKKKVERLLQLNLQRCKLLKGHGDLSAWLEEKKAAQCETELLQIEESLKNAKEQEQTIREITDKIQLIESALAGQAGETQAIKRSYYNTKNQLYNTSSHKSKHALEQSIKFNSKYNLNLLNWIQKSKNDVIKCSSTTKQFFKAPKREDYASPVRNSKIYQPNRLPLPASSYNKDYLNYQSFPVFPKHIPNGKSLPQAALTVKLSSYQHQFKDNSPGVRMIDYRDLDCTKNKLKSIDISFMENCRKPRTKPIIKQSKQKIKEKENINQTVGNDKTWGLHSADQFYTTEQKRQFMDVQIDKETQEIYKSIPKNKQLLRLKQNFRMLAQAI